MTASNTTQEWERTKEPMKGPRKAASPAVAGVWAALCSVYLVPRVYLQTAARFALRLGDDSFYSPGRISSANTTPALLASVHDIAGGKMQAYAPAHLPFICCSCSAKPKGRSGRLADVVGSSSVWCLFDAGRLHCHSAKEGQAARR